MILEPAAGTTVRFDPLVEAWFARKFTGPTAPQIAGWPRIVSGEDVLISAPTGSGKTLAAFLVAVDRLLRAARTELPDATQILYVSPLKALVNDVHANLELPLAEINAQAHSDDVPLAPIRVALRTGDSTTRDRARMLAHAPHILVTTPESLYILLTAQRSRELLRSVSTVIVDEIHAVVANKRGPHLALSLARLDRLVTEHGGKRPQRIGLSATVRPVEEVARFLSADAAVVNIGHKRDMELSVEVPQDELGPVATNEMWAEIYDRVADLIRQHRTTLIFVGTRRLSERVAHNLVARVGEGTVMPHHGSLARHIRLDTERRLKHGELRAVVATASLELGIDIGSVDLVVQLGSPRSIAVALQRIGRSGHWVGAKPKGVLFATTRDDLIECAAVVRAIRTGAMDRLEPSSNALDILAQQIVAACAADDWREDDLFALVRATHPYRDLSRADFDAVIAMLSDGIATSRGRSGALLHRDRVNGRVRGRRGARLAAITSGGAIADTTNYSVIAEPEGVTVGTVDEDFAVESMAGDIFLLGMNSWRIRRVEQGRVRVDDAHGAPPTIPFWRGEAPGRTRELSQEVSHLRTRISEFPESAIDYLERECGLDRLSAEQAVHYVRDGEAALGAVPTCDTVIAERFFDESGGMQLVVHAPFGARVNRAWGLALRKRFCRSFNLELQAASTDNGIVISLSEQHAFPLASIFGFLKEPSVEDVLTQAMLTSPMFTARWRWDAQRFLALLRFRNGRKVPANIQRMRADDLLAAVFPDQAACPENLGGEEVRIPDHPLVNEAIKDCLHEAMDIDGLKAILNGISDGTIRTLAVDTAEPSKFSHEILNANPFAYLDDAPLEERRARAVQLRNTLRADVIDRAGGLDSSTIVQVEAESWPVVRSADELHDALLTLIALPPQTPWRAFFDELSAQGRASLQSDAFWVPTEKLEVFNAAHAGEEMAVAEIVRGWMESIGPVTAETLSQRLAFSQPVIDAALLRLETEGQVLRGHFTPPESLGLHDDEARPLEWCNRRVLARIHRRMLAVARREIEPVSTARYERFLAQWEHVAPGTQLHGVDGTLQIIKQLQGLEFPAAAWESEVLPQRIAHYDPKYLDALCASGEVMWGRLSPHPAFEDAAQPRNRRVRPTRVAPISLFLRDDARWLLTAGMSARRRAGESGSLSSAAIDVRAAIERNGASFFPDIVRAANRLASEVEDGLWELVAAGVLTADGFDNLRSLIDPKRRLALGRHNVARPRNTIGRWALLRPVIAAAGEPNAKPPANERDVELELYAQQLLTRWGIVFRDVALRESQAPPWRDLLATFRRLEMQGVVRGGRFVASFIGEQFCRPDALEVLRATREADAERSHTVAV